MAVPSRQKYVSLNQKKWGQSITVSCYSLYWWKYRNLNKIAPKWKLNYLKLPNMKLIIQLGSRPLQDSNCLNDSVMMVSTV